MKKQITLFFAVCLTVVMTAFPFASFAWGPDIVVNPVAGRYYSSAKISVAYDGTIYYGRLYSTVSASGPMQNWEILKSADNGLTFTDFKSSVLGPTEKYTDFDILAAGKDNASFSLFVARPFRDTVSGSSTMLLTKYDTAGVSTTVLSEEYTFLPTRGWGRVSMASDYREPNYFSSPYSFSIACVKAGGADSIIVWTDEVGGTNLKRIGLASTSRFFRNVSIAVGATSSSSSFYGRLGIAWDFYNNINDAYGGIRTMFIYPDDGLVNEYSGPFMIGSDSVSYRNPSIAMSQKNDGTGTGIGEKDIRTAIIYEYIEGEVNVRITDTILTATPDFKYIFGVPGASINSINPHIIFDPSSDNFLMTYYNKEDNTLPYAIKSLASAGGVNATIFKPNYRDASTSSTVALVPRVDINMVTGKPVFAWNDSGVSMFEYEDSYLSIDENNIASFSELLLFPNPATNLINISFKSVSSQTITISVLDIRGRKVMGQESEVMNGENFISLSTNDLADGQYVIMVSSKSGNFPLKLVIAK